MGELARSRPAVWAGCALIAVAAWGCGLGARSYDLRGQVLALDLEGGEVLVEHDEVPGLMPAMTMPFKVGYPGLLEGLRPGDLIRGRLVIRGADAYLASLDQVGAAPIDALPACARGHLLEPGEPVPAVAFLDQHGQPRTFEAWRGRAVVMTFIYTRCPFPTFCPLMDRHFAAIQREVADDPRLRDRVHLVSVTFDPAYDTPAVLRAHARELGADASLWTFLTGDRDDIDAFAARFGVAIARTAQNPTDVTHTLSTAVIDPDGALVTVYRGAEWTPQDVLHDLEALVLEALVLEALVLEALVAGS
jgi:protein SCO1/2